MSDCIFCQIVHGTLATKCTYEDEQVVAFDDLRPQAPLHQLIIPREHITTLNNIQKDHRLLVGHMIYTAQQLAKRQNIAKRGYRLIWNCNQEGGQTVYHIHLHVLGGRAMTWPPG